jgi:hypothetical protein
MGRTRLETPVLCYDHIPDWLVDLLPVTLLYDKVYSNYSS